MVNGDKIRTLRKEKNLNTYEFARVVDASQTTIVHIEKNVKQPSIALLKRIAEYFGVKIDDLIMSA